ncbi:MAG: Thiol-disulfide oxidoreductase ResA [Phycisphaerae bacterium]|nr:Thiol-disulfide oxidoreductase ResA [Phycisphaerae bacterium]
MKKQPQMIIGLVLGAAVTSLLGCGPGLATGRQAPDFTLENISGQRVTLSQYRGQAVLLNFWAVGCPDCRREAPFLRDIQNQYADRGLRVLAVNVWDEPAHRIQEYVRENNLSQQVLLGGHDLFVDVYRGKFIPHTYLLDRQGKIVYAFVDWNEEIHLQLLEEVDEALDD